MEDDSKERRFEEDRGDVEEEEEKEEKTVLGIFTTEQFYMLCVGIGLAVLLLVITVTSIVVNSGPSELVPFPTDGDMLDFLIQNGEIQEKDGLHATWYHAANNKSEMTQALNSEVMILEADVNVQGHATPNVTNITIMAHPPAVYSDNTLDEWLDAVMKSKKGIKLDFKSLRAVEPSLDILSVKNLRMGINRPVWLNADILPGPNVPGFWPVINATGFFELVQRKFPKVTISPGWAVLYIPLFPNVTYTQAMVEDMYGLIQHVPQKVSFPIMAVMAKRGWPHISWLLSQSPRFSLTMWQGTENPSVDDLLFIRDNSSPQRVYYDIYEPVLSQFKEAAKQRDRPRQFYPGGDLTDYFKPANNDGLHIQWETVADRRSLLSVLRDGAGGMLVIPVETGVNWPKIPVVEGSNPELPLQECLELILASRKPWGLYLRVRSQSQLAASLHLLSQAYDRDVLRHPTWINMDVSHGAFQTQGYITGEQFLSTVSQTFPYVTLAPGWPREALAAGYTPALVGDMVRLFQGVWQDVSLQLRAGPLGRSGAGRRRLLQAQPRFSLTLENGPQAGSYSAGLLGSAALRKGSAAQRSFYNMPKDYKAQLSVDTDQTS